MFVIQDINMAERLCCAFIASNAIARSDQLQQPSQPSSFLQQDVSEVKWFSTQHAVPLLEFEYIAICRAKTFIYYWQTCL